MALTPLSISDSTIKIYNAALAKIGVPKISAFTDNSLAARTGNALMADVLEAVFAAYPWRHARVQAVLARNAGDAPKPWQGSYALPTEALAVRKVFEDGQSVLFDVFERNVVTMTSATSTAVITAEFTAYTTPDKWPGYFRDGLTWAIAAQVAMPITQDEKTAQWAADMSRSSLAMAKSRDAQGRSPNRIDTKGFIRARRSGGGL